MISTSSVLRPRCTRTLSITTWKNSGETKANICRKNEATSTSPSKCRYLWIAPMNQVMSKRRVISDSPARRVIRINSPSQSASSSACVIRTGRAVCGYCTRTLPSPALAMTMKPPSRSAAIAGSGVFASRDQSLRQARALRPRSLAHRSISGAPIFVVPSRCLICSRSAATPWKCRTVTRDSSPESAGVALFDSVLTYGLRGSMSPQACGCARTGCWIAAASAIGAAPWPSPAVTKVDAMDWPSKAAADGAPTGDWITTPLPVPWSRTS